MSDPQRHRLYEAQGVLDDHPIHFRSMEQMQGFVDKIVASDWWRERSDVKAVKVFLGRRDSSWAKAYSGGSWRGEMQSTPFITVPPTWACTHRTVIHELAHVCAGNEHGHGPKYAACYLAMVDKFMGSLPAKMLRKAFDEQRVEYGEGLVKSTNKVQAEAMQEFAQAEHKRRQRDEAASFLSLLAKHRSTS